MVADNNTDNVILDGSVDSPETVQEAGDPRMALGPMPKEDVRFNMKVLVMLEAIFFMGITDLGMALQPLLVYLKASNLAIGIITNAMWAGVLGVFLSPWISRRFPIKKRYLFYANVPYIGALGMMGLGVVFSRELGLSNPHLLIYVLICMLAHWFFAGFVSLPHTEYIAACIPMSHRGRYSGFSFTVAGIASMASSAIGGLILLKVSKPMSFGYLFLMTWAICQSGYILALFAKERPTPVERSPKPWSKTMLTRAKDDKLLVTYIAISGVAAIVITPLFGFVNVYGYRDLKMIPATAAVIALISQIVRISTTGLAGIITDRLTPKRVLPYTMIVAFLALLPPIFLHNAYGVYLSAAFSTLYFAGGAGPWNALLYGIPSPEDRSGHFTIQLLVSYYIATPVGPLLIGFLCDHLPYRTVFIFGAVASLVLFPVLKRAVSIFPDRTEAYG
jgi:MFS family permease